jgi:hypothetical protein
MLYGSKAHTAWSSRNLFGNPSSPISAALSNITNIIRDLIDPDFIAQDNLQDTSIEGTRKLEIRLAPKDREVFSARWYCSLCGRYENTGASGPSYLHSSNPSSKSACLGGMESLEPSSPDLPMCPNGWLEPVMAILSSENTEQQGP